MTTDIFRHRHINAFHEECAHEFLFIFFFFKNIQRMLFLLDTAMELDIFFFANTYIIIIIIIIIIIMALKPFVGPWPHFQFLDPIQSQ
jgi:hypothetical protein